MLKKLTCAWATKMNTCKPHYQIELNNMLRQHERHHRRTYGLLNKRGNIAVGEDAREE